MSSPHIHTAICFPSILLILGTLRASRPIGDALSSTSFHQQSVDFANSTPFSPKSQYDAPGFLGSTSYSAVYTEHAKSSGIGPENDIIAPTVHQDICDPTAMTTTRVERGARILVSLNDLSLIERLADRWYLTRQGLGTPIPLVRAIIRALKASHEGDSSDTRELDLMDLSSRICLSSRRPLKVAYSTAASDYIGLFVGQNLRWETLGILFSIAGASAMTLSDQEKSIFVHDDRSIDRKSFASQMMVNSDDVLSFCEHYRQPNDLMLWLMFENFTLVTLHHGDSSKLCLLILARISTIITNHFRSHSLPSIRRSLHHRTCHGTSPSTNP